MRITPDIALDARQVQRIGVERVGLGIDAGIFQVDVLDADAAAGLRFGGDLEVVDVNPELMQLNLAVTDGEQGVERQLAGQQRRQRAVNIRLLLCQRQRIDAGFAGDRALGWSDLADELDMLVAVPAGRQFDGRRFGISRHR